jgi:hypothetical protein
MIAKLKPYNSMHNDSLTFSAEHFTKTHLLESADAMFGKKIQFCAVILLPNFASALFFK